MSYILDALKKNQAEQQDQGISVGVQSPSAQSGWPRWLGIALGFILIANMALLAWVFVLPGVRQSTPAEGPPPAAKPAPIQQPLAQRTAEVPPQSEPAAQPIEVAPVPAAEARSSGAPVTAAPTPQPSAPQPSAPQPSAPQPSAPSVVALRDLPEAERLLYDGFTYSTHIYTDDPQLCAIVVDGIRLTAGDAFKGLIVDSVTEQGVIFEEIRRGQRRLVEVSVMEQWDE